MKVIEKEFIDYILSQENIDFSFHLPVILYYETRVLRKQVWFTKLTELLPTIDPSQMLKDLTYMMDWGMITYKYGGIGDGKSCKLYDIHEGFIPVVGAWYHKSVRDLEDKKNNVVKEKKPYRPLLSGKCTCGRIFVLPSYDTDERWARECVEDLTRHLTIFPDHVLPKGLQEKIEK